MSILKYIRRIWRIVFQKNNTLSRINCSFFYIPRIIRKITLDIHGYEDRTKPTVPEALHVSWDVCWNPTSGTVIKEVTPQAFLCEFKL